MGGFFYQTNDYWAHNTKFNELFTHRWPLRIPDRGPVVGYYYGYYIVPALISKMVGQRSEAAIFCWTALGMSLGIAWLYISVGHKIRYVLPILTLGDMGHVCSSIISKIFGNHYGFENFGIEMWSNFENLFWVPNQIIPSMIIGGMLVYCVRQGIAPERMVIPAALSLWWAVFPAFTSLIVIAILIAGKWLKRPSSSINAENLGIVLLPMLLAVPILLLFISHEKPAVIGFLWTFSSKFGNRILEYGLNIALNVVAMIYLYHYFARKDRARKMNAVFYVVIVLLLILPLVRIGKVNDFLIRGSMPLLIIAGLCIFQFCSHPNLRRKLPPNRLTGSFLIVVFCIVASSSLAIDRITRAMKINFITARLRPDSILFQPVPYDAYPNVYEVLLARWSQTEADQYLGNRESIFEQFIAPK